jgi:hypothetical protein
MTPIPYRPYTAAQARTARALASSLKQVELRIQVAAEEGFNGVSTDNMTDLSDSALEGVKVAPTILAKDLMQTLTSAPRNFKAEWKASKAEVTRFGLGDLDDRPLEQRPKYCQWSVHISW